MKIDSREIFEQIGNLFYAVAIEQHIKPLELGEMKLLIRQRWMPRNFEEYQSIVTDETHLILMTMDMLRSDEVSAHHAFNQFARFYSIYPEVFTQELKQHILDTCLEFTRIFHADNPLDNIILIELKALFDNVKTNAQ